MERNPNLKEFSRQLRKEQTKEEALLWYNFLSKYTLRFRRQYIIGSYIVDFYCHKAKLIVELDGSQHCELARGTQDNERTAFLESLGLRVIRFSNLDVLRNFSSVCEAINNACVNTLSRGEGGPKGRERNGGRTITGKGPID